MNCKIKLFLWNYGSRNKWRWKNIYTSYTKSTILFTTARGFYIKISKRKKHNYKKDCILRYKIDAVKFLSFFLKKMFPTITEKCRKSTIYTNYVGMYT